MNKARRNAGLSIAPVLPHRMQFCQYRIGLMGQCDNLADHTLTVIVRDERSEWIELTKPVCDDCLTDYFQSQEGFDLGPD